MQLIYMDNIRVFNEGWVWAFSAGRIYNQYLIKNHLEIFFFFEKIFICILIPKRGDSFQIHPILWNLKDNHFVLFIEYISWFTLLNMKYFET